MSPTIALFSMNPWEIMILLGLGVLLFGRKLPDVGKYLGKGIVEFKKGLKGLEDEIDTNATAAPRHDPAALESARPPQRVATTAPKFEDDAGAVTTPPKV
jgi:sec-independent protein translocase protein TatA